MKRLFPLFAVLALGLAAVSLSLWLSPIQAADQQYSAFDRSVAHVESGVTFVDVTAADYTNYQILLTIEPADGTALRDCQVVINLDPDELVLGFPDSYTTETIRFAVARKVQGLYRIDTELQTATVTGDASDDRSVTLDLGIVASDEDARIYVILSAEQTDLQLPFLLMYRAPDSATFTTVSN